MLKRFTISLVLLQLALSCDADKGELLYSNSFGNPENVRNWTMEGPGKLTFENGWMTLYSPNETMHHVFWCPQEFPNSFIAEWDAQNLNSEAGLAIVFFAAKGMNGEDIFDSALNRRNGTFKQYVQGDIRSYHISYYANAAHNKNRGHANLRKNNTFTLLQKGAEGIPTESMAIHKIRLEKHQRQITLWVDSKKVIHYVDKDDNYWKTGKIGFRQMQWSRFRYRDFKIWALKPTKKYD
ncbi:DUF1961 family protein [Teredinibacter franksiae]|uniref:DUF1961 family protein n=1 Tax=Teredinibacter franksiae TaxID=2761453 RepID=UPI00162A20C2|nr:DUF1961 family protein [Teredinibacter franksiae]